MKIDSGSSPPVRGTCKTLQRRYTGTRFIPARAGNISIRPSPIDISPVHPRPCGEHICSVPIKLHYSGSSPPVRGTSGLASGCLASWRFIPARAGNIGTVRSGRSPRPVHPRPCGEHSSSIATELPVDGSSPPVRGTFLYQLLCWADVRFIPARAGNIC